jgi:hypothetical protein
VNVTLDRVLFKRNRVGTVHGAITLPTGGGFSVSHGTGSVGQNVQVLVENSIFDGNRANRSAGFIGGAGALFAVNTGCTMGSCPLTVVNSIFIKNRASVAGGIWVTGGGSGAQLVNVTATKNSASLSIGRGGFGGGGVTMVSGSICNSILWGNRGAHPRDLLTVSSVELDHSDVLEQSGPVTDLGGNINANPLLGGASGIHLLPGSPCIDAGTCTGAPTTDFEGDPRPIGASCDMGADEFVP